MADATRLVAELDRSEVHLGPWREAFLAVRRHQFIPAKVWIPDSGNTAPIDRGEDEQRWLRLVYSDRYVVTQVDEGATQWPETGAASSSSSAPGVMATMLDALDLHDEHRVLEIGTGTGYNAAILAHRVGAERVTTIEVDPTVAAAARRNLHAAAYPVTAICADGADGHPPSAPYDRVLVTYATINTVPYAWIQQTRAGGLIVTPWGTAYKSGALLCLDIHHDGTATGHFTPNVYLSFMPARGQRPGYLPDDPPDDPDITTTTTTLTTTDIRHAVLVFDGAFAVGLQVPHCRTWYETHPEHGYWHTIGFDDITTHSCAILNASPDQSDITIKQWGPRRLWNEIETAYLWWDSQHRPTHHQFGLTITPHRQTTWLNNPTNPVPRGVFGRRGGCP